MSARPSPPAAPTTWTPASSSWHCPRARAGLAAGFHREPRRLPFVKAPQSDVVVDSSPCNTRVCASAIREHRRGESDDPSLKGEEERGKIKRINPPFRSVSTLRCLSDLQRRLGLTRQGRSTVDARTLVHYLRR